MNDVELANSSNLKIAVIGIGAAGNAVVNNLIDSAHLADAKFIAIDIFNSSLDNSKATDKLNIMGERGFGCFRKPRDEEYIDPDFDKYGAYIGSNHLTPHYYWRLISLGAIDGNLCTRIKDIKKNVSKLRALNQPIYSKGKVYNSIYSKKLKRKVAHSNPENYKSTESTIPKLPNILDDCPFTVTLRPYSHYYYFLSTR